MFYHLKNWQGRTKICDVSFLNFEMLKTELVSHLVSKLVSHHL
nr:MAG TPA: hypothetical protein [Caudoviricetes sp.]DAN32469.1 MAG TPA: hypothetical protein [Caudoviricetes sp.]